MALPSPSPEVAPSCHSRSLFSCATAVPSGGGPSLPSFVAGLAEVESNVVGNPVCAWCHVWKGDIISQGFGDRHNVPSGPWVPGQRRDAEGALLTGRSRVTRCLPGSGCFMDSSLDRQPEHSCGRAYLGVQFSLARVLPVTHGQVSLQIVWSTSVSQVSSEDGVRQ